MEKALTLLLLIVSAPLIADDCGDFDSINIGSFNIKLLGDGGPADTLAKVRRIAKRISEDADLDIVALQEINIGSEVWSKLLLPTLEEHGFQLTGAGAFGGSDPDRQQHVVLLHRADSLRSIAPAYDLKMETEYVRGNCRYDSVRPPVVGTYEVVDAGRKLQVIGVHLKSKRPPNGVETCDDEIRAYQASVIAEFLNETREAGVDDELVIIGDFNAAFQAPEFEALHDIGFSTLIDTECNDVSLQDCSYLVKPYASLIDHIAVWEDSEMAVWSSGRVSQPDDLSNYLKSQSDHALVWASFRRH